MGKGYMTIERALDAERMRWVFTARTNLGSDHWEDGTEHQVYRSHWTAVDPNDPKDIAPVWTRYDGEGNPFRVPDFIADGLDQSVDTFLKKQEELENQTLRDIITTAMEGGSNYWLAPEGEYKPDATGQYSDPIAVVFEADDDGDGIGDCYGWGMPTGDDMVKCEGHRVTLETVRKGMELARIISPANFTGHHFDTAIAERDAADVDSDGADVAIQFGLFGEIVYG